MIDLAQSLYVYMLHNFYVIEELIQLIVRHNAEIIANLY